MKKLRYTVGDWVQFTYTVTFFTESDKRRACAIRTPAIRTRIGQVVGYRMRREGFTKYYNEAPPEFNPTKTVYVWQVAVSVRGPVVEVFEEHMTPLRADQIPPDGLPPNVLLWSDADKKSMREEAQRAPRDSRGRFTCCTEAGNGEAVK